MTWSGYLKDLHVYDPVAMTWENLTIVVNGTPPSPRGKHGFASAGGKLYVHGGQDGKGYQRKLSRLSRFKFGSWGVSTRRYDLLLAVSFQWS